MPCWTETFSSARVQGQETHAQQGLAQVRGQETRAQQEILLNRIKAAVTASEAECREAKTRWWHFWRHFAGKLYRGIQFAKRDSKAKE